MVDYAELKSSGSLKVTLPQLIDWLAKDYNFRYMKKSIIQQLLNYQNYIDWNLKREVPAGNIAVQECPGIYVMVGPGRKLPIAIDAWKMHNLHLVPSLEPTDAKVWEIYAKQICYGLRELLHSVTSLYESLAKACVYNGVSQEGPNETYCRAVTEAVYHKYLADPEVLSLRMRDIKVPGIGEFRQLSTVLQITNPDNQMIIFPLETELKIAHTVPELPYTEDDLRTVILGAGTDHSQSLDMKTAPGSCITHWGMAHGYRDFTHEIHDIVTNKLYEEYMVKSEGDESK